MASFSLEVFGIGAIETAEVEEFRLAKELGVVGSPVLDSDGTFLRNNAAGVQWPFTVRGKGDLPADFVEGSAGPTIDGLTGGVTLVEEAEENQNMGEESSWSASGLHAPNATADGA